MNARHNFYSSVFDVINSYKRRADMAPEGRNFFINVLGLGVFGSLLVVMVFTDVGFYVLDYIRLNVASTRFSHLRSVVTSPERVGAEKGTSSPVFRIAPFADTYIDQTTPSVVYGKAVFLHLSHDPERRILYSFNIPPMPLIQSAVLFLPKNSATTGRYDVYVVLGRPIDEATTQYDNFSKIPLQKIRSGIPLAATAEIDIFPYIEPNTTFTVMLRATSGSARYPSRETGTMEIPLIEIR